MVKASREEGGLYFRPSRPLSPKRSAEYNRNAILDFIRQHSPVSRTELWSKAGLSRAAVPLIIKQLLADGLVIERGHGASRGGRRPVLLEFAKDARVVLAFNWHYRKLVAANLDYEVLAERPVEFSNDADPAGFVRVLGRAVAELASTAGLARERIAGLGLAMPGLMGGRRKDRVKLSVAQGWHDVPLGQMLERETGIRTCLETDAFVDAYGEFLSERGSKARSFVLFSVEDVGIGIAVIENGRLKRGSNGMLGEVGHIRLREDGPPCACGKRGCLQALILRAVQDNGGSWLGTPALYVGWGVALVVNGLDPRNVGLAGPAVDGPDGQRFIEQVRASAVDNILDAGEREIEIRRANLGDGAWVAGITGMVYDRVFEAG